MLTTQYHSYTQTKPTIDINRHPGRHDQSSPVVGKRAHELKGLIAKIKVTPILLALEQQLYHENDSYRHRKLIPCTHHKLGNELAKEIWRRTLDPYRCDGVNEDNAVEWAVYWPGGSHVSYINGSSLKYTQTTADIGSIPHLAAFVVNTTPLTLECQLNRDPTDDKFFPEYLCAAHELRHVEEWNLSDRTADRTIGLELLTTLQDIIYCDEIYKKIFDIDLNQEVDHDGKSISLIGQPITIGKLANFYRALSNLKGSLYEAVVCDESLAFLSGSKIVQGQRVPEISGGPS